MRPSELTCYLQRTYHHQDATPSRLVKAHPKSDSGIPLQ